MSKRTLIIGGGPIGIEAALLAHELNHQVTLVDKGPVGANLRAWGDTRFFSPFGMNVSSRVKEVLGADAPAEGALLTGPEMVAQVLEPVVQRGLKDAELRPHTQVVSVGRSKMTRRDRPGHSTRHRRPFRLLLERDGTETMVEADLVLDASGVASPLAFGAGGVPVPGERRLGERVIQTLGALDARKEELSKRRLLLVGHGHSSACALERLSGWANGNGVTPHMTVTWAVRTMSRYPAVAMADDPLVERARIVDRANQLAHEPPPWLTVERKAHVEAVRNGEDGVSVTLSGDRTADYDAILAFTGYEPDHSMLRELQVRISSVSQGAEGIHRALSNVTDCLSVPSLSAKDLDSGEPGFYLVGAKSYGRMTTFLLKNGIEQVETILRREEKRR